MSEMPIFQDLSLFQLPPEFRGRPAWFVQLWWFVQETLFRWSPQVLFSWRRFLLRLFGARVGVGVLIRPTVRITYPWKVVIGDHSWIGDDVTLYSLGEIEIGAHCVVSQKSYLCTGSHDFRKPEFPIFSRPIIVEDQAWIATDVFIAPGVRIGKGAVVGARSSVYADQPAGMLCVGNPSRPVHPRLVEGDS